ncbi:MAG TPA: hypothetical protein VN673_18785, partial [Clostridia bacterium]|nr:hypothetical protein [Clostridia bacterium]
MKFRTLIRRSLRFHARAHLGVVLGAAVGTAALAGALMVGDSVRFSLRQMAIERLGSVHFAIQTGDRPFQMDLMSRLRSAENSEPVSIKGKPVSASDLHASAQAT